MASVPQLVADAAARYGVPSALAVEVAAAESNFNQSAVSPKGAIGVMQLEPSTAADLGVNPYDLAQNVDGGARYLAQLFARFGDWAKALAAYNWGQASVSSAIASQGDAWFSAIPSSVRNYVNKILNAAGAYSAAAAPAAGSESAAAPSAPAAAPGQALLYLGLAGLGALIIAQFVFGDA